MNNRSPAQLFLRRKLYSARQRVWFPRRLPQSCGSHRVWVSPSSYLSYFTRSLEAIHGQLLNALVETLRPGQCVWDVGANLGVATVAASHLVGTSGAVVSVDANSGLIARIRRAVSRMESPGAPVEAIAAAVSDDVGVVRFEISSYSSATSAMEGFGRFPGVAEKETVVSISLDWMSSHFALPDLVKIDVEGAESLVIKGARRLLREHRPLLIVEVGSEAVKDVTAELVAADYHLYSLADLPTARHRLDLAAIDTIAIPAEKPLPWPTTAN